MERIGIFEMGALSDYINATVAVPTTKPAIKTLVTQANHAFRAKSEKRFTLLTLLENNFEMIPEGFTGVWMRDIPCQLVPNAVLPAIMSLSTKGFFHVPEDFELFLLANRFSASGKELNAQIIDIVFDWMKANDL